MLREKLDQLELENKHFKDQEQKQNEIINSLRSEIKSLKKKWKEESESNILFNQHTDPLTNIKRNAIFSADEDAGKVNLQPFKIFFSLLIYSYVGLLKISRVCCLEYNFPVLKKILKKI